MQDLAKTIPKKIRNSLWYLTININTIFNPNDETSKQLFKKFENTIDYMFSEEHIFDYIIFQDTNFDNLSLIKKVVIKKAFKVFGN